MEKVVKERVETTSMEKVKAKVKVVTTNTGKEKVVAMKMVDVVNARPQLLSQIPQLHHRRVIYQSHLIAQPIYHRSTLIQEVEHKRIVPSLFDVVVLSLVVKKPPN